jgi:hypothetical protein
VKETMLHAPISKARNQLGGTPGFDHVSRVKSPSPFCGSGLLNHERYEGRRSLPNDPDKAQSIYGNQAVLRALNYSQSSPVLQRKCACDGSGESCSRCAQKKEATLQGVASHNDSVGMPPTRHELLPGRGSSAHVRWLGHKQLVSEGGEAETKYSIHGLLMDLDGSGTCVNGGGGSVCDPDTGTYGLVSNDNTCCTKDCTAQHEAEHKKDHDGWGCCKALGVAWKKPGADKADLVKKYNEWRAKISPITECHAYSHDIVCADALAKEKDCAGKGKDTDCCKDIADYRTRYAALAKTNCDAAPKAAAACPF